MNNKTLTSLKPFDPSAFAAKTVLVRLDLNLPRNDGVVLDTNRLDRAIPTLKALQAVKAKVVILSHFGRPKGVKSAADSLAFLKPLLEARLGAPVTFFPDCIGEEAAKAIAEAPAGGCVLLENLRFYAGEEADDPQFARQLAHLGDIYINDAFAVSHRAHASVSAITQCMPSYPGPLLLEELRALTSGFLNPEKPVMAVIGGSKVSTKFQLLGNLIPKVQYLVLGGGIAHTFMAAQGISMGKSPIEPALFNTVQDLLTQAEKTGCQICLPTDMQVESTQDGQICCRALAQGPLAPDDMAYDIGPQTVATITKLLQTVRTLIWNGPLGFFERAPFDQGSLAVAKAVAEATQQGQLYSLAGGGETVAVIKQAGVDHQLSYLSTGGGAFLEFLEGKGLPGVQALFQDQGSGQTYQNTACLV